MIPEFVAFLEELPRDEYLQSHWVRYRETWLRLHDLAAGAREVLELGSLSPIGAFLRDRRGANVATVQTDLRYALYSVPDGGADMVLCLEVLEHLNDAHVPGSSIGEIAMFTHSGARTMFRECRRALRPGGRLVVTTPNLESIDTLANVLRRRHPFRYPPHVREYTQGEVAALAQEAGFATERNSTFFAWEAHPDTDRQAIITGLDAMGFDMSNRGDDAFFVFRAPEA